MNELEKLIQEQKKDDTYFVRQNGTVPLDENSESLQNGKLSKRRLIVPHGTESAYRWYRCRCQICKDYKKAASRDWYLRKKARDASYCN